MGRKSTLNRGTSGVRKKPSNSKHQNAYRVLFEKKTSKVWKILKLRFFLILTLRFPFKNLSVNPEIYQHGRRHLTTNSRRSSFPRNKYVKHLISRTKQPNVAAPQEQSTIRSLELL